MYKIKKLKFKYLSFLNVTQQISIIIFFYLKNIKINIFNIKNFTI